MAADKTEWLSDSSFPWPAKPPANKIDTHHHWVPQEYAQAIEDAGGDPSGWPMPKWSQHHSELLMDHVGCATAILSITAPGPTIVEGQASYKLARSLNLQGAAIRDSKPNKFGFFASLPSLLDTEACLAEIAFALDELHADGVTVFTRYGSGNYYLGHPGIEPIWKELDRRNAVVFVHPTHPVDTNQVNSKMPQPLVDYTHETTRTATDLLLSGTRKKYANCKIILSHAGGTLPYIISRISMPLSFTKGSEAANEVTTEDITEGFKSFYYDVALSSSPHVLKMLLEKVPHDHILYGSDFPYAPPPAYPNFLEQLEQFDMAPSLREKINFGNALQLFPRLKDASRAAL